MHKHPFLIFLCFLSISLKAQSNDQKALQILTAKQLQEDFSLLRTGLEKTHAGLYAYTPKDSLDRILNEIEKSVNKPMTSIDFFRKISPLVKLIGNGHTTFFPPPDYNEAINTYLPRFPFAVYWHQDTLYVLRNLSEDKTIKEGTIIKSINGESSVEIMQFLANNLTRDAYNDSYPKGKVERDFSGKYAFYKGTPSIFELEIIDTKGEHKVVKVNSQLTSKMIAHSKERYPNWRKNKGLPLQFKIEHNIGKLTINSFYLPSIKKAKQKYKNFFNTTFQQIKAKNIQHLIIDLRDNGGGYPEVVDELFSYLTDKLYTNQGAAYTITKNLPNQKHYKYGFWELLDIRKSLKLKKEGAIYRVVKGSHNSVVQPASNNFKGQVYILANAFTFSGATDFMGMLKNINRGVFIGEIAGGSPHQVTAWLMPSLILPNTRIEAIIPLVCTKITNNYPDSGLGIVPDFFIRNSINEVLQGKDSVMEFTLKKIKENQ